MPGIICKNPLAVQLFVGHYTSSEGTGVDRKPIWEVVEEINAGLPADTWENVPTDGSINLGHYLYGAPKRQP
jgi:hypothetical protein